jgi:hypothetical protein
MMDKPLQMIKTTSQDIEAYQQRRTLFLDCHINFKSGFAEQGILALNYLQQMYYILPAGRHIKLDDGTKSEVFINTLDAMRLDILQYVKRKDASKKNFLEFQDYQELDNKMDALVRSFFKILFEVGFTP